MSTPACCLTLVNLTDRYSNKQYDKVSKTSKFDIMQDVAEFVKRLNSFIIFTGNMLRDEFIDDRNQYQFTKSTIHTEYFFY